MGKFICFNSEKQKKNDNNFCSFHFLSSENIVKMDKLDRGGNCGRSKATVDNLLVQSGFQYYFLFCWNKLVLS